MTGADQIDQERPAGLTALAGLRVIEMGVWVAAPSAGALLADWGADVIKVEPPSGDPMRSAFGSLGIGQDLPNPAFAQDNRGKRSVVLDLRRPESRERLEELLSTADVFLTNLRPDALDGLGLEANATVARHPRLVYCSVSGYGLRGEDRNRPAYDIGAFWARTGLSVQLANSEGVPLNARGGIGDHISGLAALAGLLAAVLEQRQTGRGRVVEVSLLRTGAYVLGWDLSLQENLGKVAKSEARQSNQTPLMNSYRTKDGRWFFFTGLEADRHIGPVLRALGRTDLRDDPRFESAGATAEPHGGHRRPRRHRGGADAGRVGRAPRCRGRVVGARPGTGRRTRRPPARRQRRVPEAAQRGRRDDAAVDQRAGELLGPSSGEGGAGAVARRAHRGGALRIGRAPGSAPTGRLRPDRGRGPGGPGR